MADAISDKLLKFLIEITGEAKLQPDTDLLMSGLLDSLTMMDLVIFVEMEFQQRIAVEDMQPEYFQSVSTISQLIARGTIEQSRAA